jgi:hypothetical protein
VGELTQQKTGSSNQKALQPDSFALKRGFVPQTKNASARGINAYAL